MRTSDSANTPNDVRFIEPWLASSALTPPAAAGLGGPLVGPAGGLDEPDMTTR